LKTGGGQHRRPFLFSADERPMNPPPLQQTRDRNAVPLGEQHRVVYSHVILVLKAFSLSVPKGGIVALLGAKRAGKTTTLKAISNLAGQCRARRGHQGLDPF